MRVIGRQCHVTLTAGAHVKAIAPGTSRFDAIYLRASRGPRHIVPALVFSVGEQRESAPDANGWQTIERDIIVARIGRRGRRVLREAAIPDLSFNGSVLTGLGIAGLLTA